MELNTLWFILVSVLFTGFFVLEGFDYGVGILMPWIGKNELERRTVIRSIGPFWDGNEVWLLTAGGAIFAAFPQWYATLFSTLYIPFVVLLVALILRAVGFEWRNKSNSAVWRQRWDWIIFAGSLLPAFLVGVAITTLIHGVPIDGSGHFKGNLLDLLQPFPLLGGIASLSVFTWLGSLFLQLKLKDDILRQRTLLISKQLSWGILFVFLALGIYGYTSNAILAQSFWGLKIAPILATLSLLLSILLFSKKPGQAFIATILTIVLTSISLWSSLFPNTMISTMDVSWNLTILNSSSTPYTLKIMTVVAAIFVPVVLIYQTWNFWIFRQRVKLTDESEY